MEKLNKRKESLQKILKSLSISLDFVEEQKDTALYEPLRDSAIQRFEYTIDQTWKFLKLIIQEKEGVDVTSAGPNSILQISFEYNLISSPEKHILQKALADRNLTSHTYHEEIAEEVLASLREYQEAIAKIVDRLS